MKRSVYVMISVLMLASCETYIDLTKTGPDKILVLNGNIVAGDTLHTVYLSWSRFSGTAPVRSAHLECYVNGVLQASTSDMFEPNRFSYDAYGIKFKAPFEAGDEVRICVTADGERVEAVGVAPKAPEISAVDTSFFKKTNDKGGKDKYCMSKIHLKDIHGERNYYRVLIALDSEYKATNVTPGAGYEEGQRLSYETSDCKIDNTYESLLYRSMKIGDDGEETGEYNYYSNRYNIFTDNAFEDAEYTLKLAVRTGFHNVYSGNYSSDYDLKEYMKLRFRVLSLSKDTYTYMNDYAFDESSQSHWTFIDPIPYPSNVTGGIGLVSIMSPADYYIYLGTNNLY